jgi:hypothetical protein
MSRELTRRYFTPMLYDLHAKNTDVPAPGEGTRRLASLGRLEKTNLNRWKLTDPILETLCFIFIQTSGRWTKSRNPAIQSVVNNYTPTFRFYGPQKCYISYEQKKS